MIGAIAGSADFDAEDGDEVKVFPGKKVGDLTDEGDSQTSTSEQDPVQTDDIQVRYLPVGLKYKVISYEYQYPLI